MRLFACFLAFAWLIPTAAFAQVDLVDPDVAPARKKAPVQPLDDGLGEPDAPGSTETVADDDPTDGTLVAPPSPKKDKEKDKEKDKGKKGAGGKDAPREPAKGEAPPKKEPPRMLVKAISDSDLNAVWLKWKQANASKNAQAE